MQREERACGNREGGRQIAMKTDSDLLFTDAAVQLAHELPLLLLSAPDLLALAHFPYCVRYMLLM